MNNVVILIGSYPPPFHGSSIYLKNLTELLSNQNNLEVLPINCSDRENDLTNMGRWSYKNIYFGLIALIKLLFTLISKKINIVYVPISQNTLAFFRDGLYILTGRLLGSKVLIHLHGSYFTEFYRKSNFFMKKYIDLVMKSCSGAIVLGYSLKYVFRKWFDDSKIFVLPNFSEEIKFNKRRIAQSTLKITYLGNLVESKGIFQLLEAFSIVEKSFSNVQLHIAGKFGKDPYTGMTEEDTKTLFFNFISKYPQNIIYHGQIFDPDKKVKFLYDSDIFVFPSWIEGQPLVILEAMSCGLPIISTKNCGVIDETVIDGFNGILVEKKNIVSLTAAIKTLILNVDLRNKMAENSLKRFREFYTPDKHIFQFISILKNITY